jgi:hypothetical protein
VLIQAVNDPQVNRMLYLAKKTTPMPLNYQPLLLVQAQMALLSMASQRVIGVATQSPVIITKPPIPAAMSDNSMALVLSFLPNTTYDLPALDLPLGSAR